MNKVTQSIYKKKVDNLEEGGGGGGAKLYRHNLLISGGNNSNCCLTVYNKISAYYTLDTLKADAVNLGVSRGPEGYIPASGTINADVSGKHTMMPVVALYYQKYAGILKIVGFYNNEEQKVDITVVNDVVVEL